MATIEERSTPIPLLDQGRDRRPDRHRLGPRWSVALVGRQRRIESGALYDDANGPSRRSSARLKDKTRKSGCLESLFSAFRNLFPKIESSRVGNPCAARRVGTT